MTSPKNPKLLSPVSILAQIIEGSIKIDSIEEFDTILEIFPDDPELHRVYSDLLFKENKLEAAAESYGNTAEYYLEASMPLQAIVAKSLQWKIKPPSDLTETHQFFSMVHRNRYPKTPINAFFGKLTYPELFALINSFVPVRLSPGSIFKKNGDGENELFVVVSGSLKETSYLPLKFHKETVYEKLVLNFYENDFFGDFYPFKDKILSQSYLEATTQVELVKISKKNLINICKKYQDVELAINDLKKSQSEIGKMREPRQDRQWSRHYLPTKVDLKIFSDPKGTDPLLIEGYSLDLSIGGICVLLDSIDENNALFSKAVQNAAVQISLPIEAMSLNVSGTIVWSKTMRLDKEETFALGIKFEDMSPKLKGIVLSFADSICNRKEFASLSPFKVH